MMTPHGCYCAAMGSIGPEHKHAILAWIHGFLYLDTSPYWTDPQIGLDTRYRDLR